MDVVTIDETYLRTLDGKDRLAVSANEGAMLSKLVEKKVPLKILEVGTGHGYSSAWISLAMKRNALLYTIDDVDRPQILHDKRIKLLHGTLQQNLQYIPTALDFIFLDSDHQVHMITADIELLEKNMRPGTTVVVHDTIYCEEMGLCLKDYFSGIHSDRLKVIGIGPSKLHWTFEFMETEYGLVIATLGEAHNA